MVHLITSMFYLLSLIILLLILSYFILHVSHGGICCEPAKTHIIHGGCGSYIKPAYFLHQCPSHPLAGRPIVPQPPRNGQIWLINDRYVIHNLSESLRSIYQLP